MQAYFELISFISTLVGVANVFGIEASAQRAQWDAFRGHFGQDNITSESTLKDITNVANESGNYCMSAVAQ